MPADIGIPEFGRLPYANPADFERLAEASFLNGSPPSNCRALTKEDYLDLLWKVYGRKPTG
jgi:alcohol dehydrogenase